jgi:hypothetical protein
LLGAAAYCPRGVRFEDAVDGAKGSKMVHNRKEIDFSRDEFGEPQQLVWKGALVLLCLGIFALVMWSGARDPAQRCTETDPVAQETCMQNLRAQAPQRPAKGAFPLVSGVAERRAD